MDGNNFNALKSHKRHKKEIFCRRKARGDWLDIDWKILGPKKSAATKYKLLQNSGRENERRRSLEFRNDNQECGFHVIALRS